MKQATSTDAEYRRYRWLRRNRGILARIAEELGCTGAAVSQVFTGASVSERIAEALARAGAPGFRPKGEEPW